MSDSEKDGPWIPRVGVGVLVVNLLVTSANAVWLWKYQSASLVLTEKQYSIDEKLKSIDLTVKEAKNSLSLQLSQLNVLDNTLNAIEQLNPKPEIVLAPGNNFAIIGNEFSQTWQISNLGKFSFVGDKLIVYLSTNPIIDDEKPPLDPVKLLNEKVDELGILAPNSKRLMSLHASFVEKPKIIYWVVKLTVHTNSNLIEYARKNLNSNVMSTIQDQTTISMNGYTHVP